VTAASRPSLHVENLSISRGGRILAKNLSFNVDEGEALIITGPNGAGKSTLLRVLAGLLPPAGGKISLSGREGDELPLHTHYVGHADALKSALTPRENLGFWSRALHDNHRGMRTSLALERVGLGHLPDLPVSYLSAGQRRRVALARLLVAPRSLWLLDEPSTALDAASQDRLRHLMEQHLAAGGMIVAATHMSLGLSARELPLRGAA
jgi:heme exporter protein A